MPKDKEDKKQNTSADSAEEEQREKKTEATIEQQLTEMEENWKRALADYKNLQKRVAEEKEEVVNFANFVLIAELLPVLDNLELVLKHNGDEGLKMIVSEFCEVLKNAGVEEINPMNAEFDPTNMDATEKEGENDGDLSDWKVLEVLQKGYKIKDRLIRPARVKVGRA